MTAAKVKGCHSKATRLCRTSSRRSISLHPCGNERRSNFWKFQCQNVLIFGNVFHETIGPNHGQTLKTLWFLLNGICTVTHLLACCWFASLPDTTFLSGSEAGSREELAGASRDANTGMTLLSTRTVWLWVQRDDGNKVPWNGPEFISCFTITRRWVLKWGWRRPVWSSARCGLSRIKADVLRTWSHPESLTFPPATGKLFFHHSWALTLPLHWVF